MTIPKIPKFEGAKYACRTAGYGSTFTTGHTEEYEAHLQVLKDNLIKAVNDFCQSCSVEYEDAYKDRNFYFWLVLHSLFALTVECNDFLEEYRMMEFIGEVFREFFPADKNNVIAGERV